MNKRHTATYSLKILFSVHFFCFRVFVIFIHGIKESVLKTDLPKSLEICNLGAEHICTDVIEHFAEQINLCEEKRWGRQHSIKLAN